MLNLDLIIIHGLIKIKILSKFAKFLHLKSKANFSKPASLMSEFTIFIETPRDWKVAKPSKSLIKSESRILLILHSHYDANNLIENSSKVPQFPKIYKKSTQNPSKLQYFETCCTFFIQRSNLKFLVEFGTFFLLVVIGQQESTNVWLHSCSSKGELEKSFLTFCWAKCCSS